jgi:hypothetical protein
MERLGGDAAVAQTLLAAARGAGADGARVGIASTCIAAALATRERGSAWRIVPPGRDRDFVARRPLTTLPMERTVRETLARLGLRTCADLAARPASEIEILLGAEGLDAWRLCRAEDPRWPFRPQTPELPAAEADFEPGIEGTEPLRFVLPGLVEAVLAEAARWQRLPGALRLELRTEDRAEHALDVRPARPTGDVRVLVDLARLALEGVRLEGRISAVRLEAMGWEAAGADQLDAFLPAAPDPSAVLAALAGVLARWGEDALCQALPQGAHLPGRHAEWRSPGREAITRITRPPTVPRPPTGRGDSLTLCPHRLEPPEAVRVEVDAAGHPVAFWRGMTRAAVWADAPERLSGEWWAEGAYARDLYIAAVEQGPLWILAREGRTGAWRLEGWYD